MVMDGRTEVLFMEIMSITSTVTKSGKLSGLKTRQYLDLFKHLNNIIVFGE